MTGFCACREACTFERSFGAKHEAVNAVGMGGDRKESRKRQQEETKAGINVSSN